MKQYRFLLYCLIILNMLSCRKEDNYQVEAELDPYLQLFLQEASKRGMNLNVEENGLLMKFDNLTPPTIGLCTYSNPILVQIDPTYWNKVKEYDNCEDLRQNVVFHELAHGLLNREHDNGTLDNSEWKSLMCGGDLFHERSWQVNFRGERRQYYLDELFNARTPQPSWAEYGVKFSGEKGKQIIKLDLSEEKKTTNQNGNVYQISNGNYTISINEKNNIIVPLFVDLNLTGDFYYEVVLTGNLVGNGECTGLVATYEEKEERNYHLFSLIKNRTYGDYRCYASNTKCMDPIAEVILKTGVCNIKNEYTTLGIERRGSELYFYINDQLIYRNDFDANKPISRLAVVAPTLSTINIKEAACYNKTELKAGYFAKTIWGTSDGILKMETINIQQ